jgi:hypothetical protein
MSRTCPSCHGEAVTRGNCRCEECDGHGFIQEDTFDLLERIAGPKPAEYYASIADHIDRRFGPTGPENGPRIGISWKKPPADGWNNGDRY